MADEEFDEHRFRSVTAEPGDNLRPHAEAHELSPRSVFRRHEVTREPAKFGAAGGDPTRPGIVWVRASDLLNNGTGRIAGRGLDFEAELARRLRRAPATTRRSIRERAHKLPPLSAFGQSSERPPIARDGLGRR